MAAVIIMAILAAPAAWFGWQKRIRTGALTSLLFAAILALIAAFTISIPSDVGGPWVFAVSFVLLAGVSLLSLGMARWVRRLLRRD